MRVPAKKQGLRSQDGDLSGRFPEMESKWIYSFTAFPDEQRSWSRAARDVFGALLCVIEMPFTETEFAEFRATLEGDGLILHEIQRVPCVEPEHVP